MLYAQTLRRDGPSIDDTEARIAFWEGKLSGKRKPGQAESFVAWVRSKGGVRDIDGALEASLGKGHGLPSSIYMTARGAKRSQRGVDFEDLYLQAVNEGFVTTKQEFIDAFRSHAGGIVAPVIRRADSDALDKVAEEAEYVKAAIEQAGVNPRASNKVKARAITGREQHVVASERARLQSALTRLEARREAILKGEQPLAEPKPDENKPEPEKLPTETEETVEVGDTVETVGSEEFTLSGGEGGVRVTHVYDDPVYGKWAMVEGSNSAIELSKLQVKKKGEKPKDTLSAAVEADQKPQPEGKRSATEDEQTIFTRARHAFDYKDKFKIGREFIDQQFPAMAQTGAYYYSAFLALRDNLEMGLLGAAKWLNKAIKSGDVVIRDADTGEIVRVVDSRYTNLDTVNDMPDLVITFKNAAGKGGPVTKKAKTKEPKLGPVSPEENARLNAEMAAVGAEALAAAGPRPPMPDTPKAEMSALTAKELAETTSQLKALEAKTLKRLDSLIKTMSPETAATIRAQLAKIDTESKDLAAVYESAIQCLLKP